MQCLEINRTARGAGFSGLRKNSGKQIPFDFAQGKALEAVP